MDNKQLENERAERISLLTNMTHDSLTTLYESLVDRDFVLSKSEIKAIQLDMKFVLKKIVDDDF